MPYPSKTDRSRILAAGIQQIEERGLRGLSLRLLAASLELAPTALYRYFADRAVLEAALTAEVSRMLHTAMQRASRKGAPEQAIRSIARAYLAFARKHPNLYELVFLPCSEEGEEASARETLWRFVVEHVSQLTGPGRAEEAALALWSYLHGIAQLEAKKIFHTKEAARTLEFGLYAWLFAASTRSRHK